MSDDFVPKLTGGILFSLLLRERKQRYTKQENTEGKSDGLSDKYVLQALLEVANPTTELPFGDSAKTNSSQFKTCRIDKSSWFPLLSMDFIEAFEYQMNNNYSATLVRMNNLFKNYIDKGPTRTNRLGRSILDLIARDTSIPDDAIFYIKNGTDGVKKADMLPNDKYELQPLVLGVWYYLISHKVKNTDGEETFYYIHSSSVEHGNYDINFDISTSQYNETLIIALSDFDTRLDLEEQNNTVVPEIPYDFTEYLNKIENKYKDVKTFLYKNSPKYFYEFYVCNDIMPKAEMFYFPDIDREYYAKKGAAVKDVKMYDLYSKFGNYLLITANGGMGKSMMMRHLLLDSILNYTSNKLIPIFVPLKDYPESCTNLLDFVFDNVYNHEMSMDQLKYILTNGYAVVLFDGLDEIKNSLVSQFEKQLEYFTDRYSSSVFVISSRPYKDFSVYARFKELQLMSLSKKQAMELIEKLKFREDDPSIKNGFMKKLKDELYRTHKEFANNPLLLTIMLVTYEYYREIPSKMHKFYHDAYEALAWKHDTAKTSFRRQWHTGLTPDDFAEYLSEFSFRTYYKEKFEFTYEEGQQYFNDLKISKKDGFKLITYRDFIDDLAHNMCLIYFESGKYHFIHRSFQEYFCARYLSKQKDSVLPTIGDMFEKKSRRHYTDQTFPMFYDMNKEKIEQYIFIPYLEKLFKKCDENEGFLTFLKNLYPKIYYCKGNCEGLQFISNTPDSFLFSFILKISGHQAYVDLSDLFKELDVYDEFVEEWFTWVTESNDEGEDQEVLVGSRQFANTNDDLSEEFEPVGWSFCVDINKVLEDKETYKDILDLLQSEECPLYEQYNEMKEILEKYKAKYSDNADGNDLYDII